MSQQRDSYSCCSTPPKQVFANGVGGDGDGVELDDAKDEGGLIVADEVLLLLLHAHYNLYHTVKN